jgi:radical SAM superfamily enzyme YgiQ (UPF0313 family)
MTLGILKVAAVLEQAGVGVDMLDLSGVENYEEVVRDYVKTSPNACYGLTATTPQMPAATKIYRVIRAQKPGARIILGGPHVTLIHAAYKFEQKGGRKGRAITAYRQLEEMFDVLVVGDGELAIFEALSDTPPKLVDGDDPKSEFFLNNQKLTELPFPARHLVDVNSYHYSIDGVRALSMIAQLGCLAAGTNIRLSSGREIPIEDVKVGDLLLCWSEDERRFDVGPVAAAWNREADDLWKLRTSCGTLLVTSEHPIWTETGWKKVADLEPGKDRIGYLLDVQSHVRGEAVSREHGALLQQSMPPAASAENVPDLSEGVYADAGVRAGSQLLLSTMPVRVDAHARQREVVARWAGGGEGAVGFDDPNGAGREIEHQSVACQCADAARAQALVGYEARRAQSDEAPRDCREGVVDYQGEVGAVLFGSDEALVEGWEDPISVAEERYDSASERERASPSGYPDRGGADVSVRRQPGVLDWAVRVWTAAQSRLHRRAAEEGDLAARRVLAPEGVGGDRGAGLYVEGLEGAGGVVEGASTKGPTGVAAADTQLRFSTLVAREWVGPSRVYNLTVCPGHSYIANGIVVHNCPFGCGFCGGRMSPFLRRIRMRTSENIVQEMVQLYETYGVTGFMLYDDELNVNPKIIELMDLIAKTQGRLGVEFRLRGFIKAELFTDEQAEAMYGAGFRWILVGFESGHERILTNIQKKAARADNSRCMAIAKRHGLKVKALMSVGHPGESEDTVRATRDWLLEVRPDDFDATVITTYPGTPYFDEAMETSPGVWTYTYPKSGDRLHSLEVDYREVAEYYKGVPGEYTSYVYTDFLNAKELVKLRDWLEASVRDTLGIPYNSGAPAVRYEHSMGQGVIPTNILRTTSSAKPLPFK